MTNATVGRRPDGPGWCWYEDAPVPDDVRQAIIELSDEIWLARMGDVQDEEYGRLVRDWLAMLPAHMPPPQWSQEPPDEERWYWFVGTLTMIDDDGHILDHARCSRPNAVFVRSDGYVNYDGMPWSASGSDGHWLPASVPPPPKGADNE